MEVEDYIAALSREGTRGAGDAESALDGPAAGLYVFLWNRSGPGPAGVTVTGDPGAIATWQSSVRVSW